MIEPDGVAAAGPVDEVIRIAKWITTLSTDHDDPTRIDLMRGLMKITSATAAAQAQMTTAFAESQREEQRAAGVRAERIGQGIAAQVALARRESPAHATRYVGWARILVEELPATFAALQRGETTEWRTMLVARETGWLTREQRGIVDAELDGRLAGLGDQDVAAEAKRIAYRLDPQGAVDRSRKAASDRRVTIRPAPDTMTRLTALLPVGQGVAAYVALNLAAQAARAAGDERGRGQVMADTLVERITGQAVANQVPVEVTVVMTDRAVDMTTDRSATQDASPTGGPADARHPARGDRDEPAHLVGYGPIPAGIARDLVLDAARAWVRRLSTDPVTGRLTALDPRRREFDGVLRQAIVLRDQFCRTPWCGAPIRHGDHVIPASVGGETTLENGQGLCEACNYAKIAPGWTCTPAAAGASESVTITTPTGHTYLSRPPDLPGPPTDRTLTEERAGPSPPPELSHYVDWSRPRDQRRLIKI